MRSQFGLEFAGSPEFEAGADELWALLGIHTPTRHAHADVLLLDAARKLGWAAAPVSMNSRGCADDIEDAVKPNCNLCMYGCAAGRKQSNLVTTLRAACATGRCRVAAGLRALKIVFDAHGRVAGVLCRHVASGRDVVVSAPRVVSAAGAMGTPPLLLLRSGVRDPQVGKNLRLHPVFFVCPRMPKSSTNNWNGPCKGVCAFAYVHAACH